MRIVPDYTYQSQVKASILVRKELLAGRVLRLPLISRVYDTLQRDDTQTQDCYQDFQAQ